MLKYVNFDIVFQEIPDEVTLAINISNCPNRCTGCHSPFLQQDEGEPLTKDVLASLLQKYGKSVTCFCFMGGDNAPDEIADFAKYIHSQTNSQIKTGWYSGKQELPKNFRKECFEYVKLGPYVEKLGTLKSKSTNQRLYKINKDGKMEDLTYRFRKDALPS